MTYDSTKDTKEHIENVKNLLQLVVGEIVARALRHDASKLLTPEKEIFDEFTPKLKDSTYGSDEYKSYLKDMGVALQHHYEHNSHHPEYYKLWKCPVCNTVFTEDDAPISAVLEGDKRLCPRCCAGGTIMECMLEPVISINGMSLLDVIEMLADWKAAGMRHADGDIQKSLEINKKRFDISDQMAAILENTVKEFDW
jgi:rubrerythrin